MLRHTADPRLLPILHLEWVHSLPEPGEYGDLDLPLPRIAGVVLQDLDCHDLVGPLLPALCHLTEGAATKELEDLILVIEGGVEDLVLDQLVVAITVGAPPGPALASATRLAD